MAFNKFSTNGQVGVFIYAYFLLYYSNFNIIKILQIAVSALFYDTLTQGRMRKYKPERGREDKVKISDNTAHTIFLFLQVIKQLI